ncbi:MAG: 2Fe-2S iron-sulfur cluster binding domain-containing protein, partial [Nitrospirae bacterium]|nr:2Fe-2S iron-sulfur cluster binding domain-containing protein [Nitrospirota bacterium]
MQLQITGENTINVNDGETIYGALKRNGIYLVAPCGGKSTCGKCKVKILEGKAECRSYGRLQQSERLEGVVLACQTTLKTPLFIEIPKQSRLVLGGKIAVSIFKDTAAYLKSYDVEIDPIVKRSCLQLPPPTISDNLSDLERLKRALSDHGLGHIRFSYELVTSISDTLREANWSVTLSYKKG